MFGYLFKNIGEEKLTHKVIGVHFLADHADTLIGAAIHPHPTQTELFGDMARRLSSSLKRAEKRKKK